MEKSTVLESVMREFRALAAIPRPSGHEKAGSDYLLAHLQEMGLEVVQDERGNIIADLAATPGRENAPRVILQGHMDMVCVAAPGVSYDPLQDAIELLEEGDMLRAKGTSLGADDGIGVAIILHILRHVTEHGPVRVIFTVDEERGMTGAIHLEEKYLQDAQYLINCDSENLDELCVGSAGGVDLTFSRTMKLVAAPGKSAWQVAVGGLQGGHSGEEIGTGRANALRLLSLTLAGLQEAGISFALASLAGGKAKNAIASEAAAVIVTEASEEKLREALQGEEAKFRRTYSVTEPSLSLSLAKALPVQQVIAADDAANLLRILRLFHTGIYQMSALTPGMVETSANLGIVHMEGAEVDIDFYPRSSVEDKIFEFCCMAKDLAELTGFSLHIGTIAPSWDEDKANPLAEVIAEAFVQRMGKPMKVETIHAGLECGWFYRKNPQMKFVSVGVTTHDIHSPKESLDLPTVEPLVDILSAALKKLAEH